MNSRNKIVLLAVVIVGVLATVKWRPTTNKAEPPATDSQTIGKTAPGERITNPPVVTPPDTVQKSNAGRAPRTYARTVHELAMVENGPLQFYGRVLNQAGTPVSGANVRVIHSRYDETWILNPRGEGPGAIYQTNELISDPNGRVALQGGTARSLYVEKVVRDGYLYNEVPKFFNYSSSLVPRNSRSLPDYMNSSAGTVLHVWRKNPVTNKLLPIERKVTLHLPSVTSYEIPLLGDGSSLKLTIQMPKMHPNDESKAADRLVVYELSEGEIQETQDSYPYQAPLTGYSNRWVRAFEPSKREVNGWNLPYYVRARNGKIFGAIQIDFLQRQRGFLVTGYLNLDGLQNLEPDPNKFITDPEEIRRLDEATRVK